MDRFKSVICMLAAVSILLSACSGPETRVLTRQEAAEAEGRAFVEIKPVPEPGNPFEIEENLNYLTFVPCVAGSGEEQLTALYLIRVLRRYGYQVVRNKNMIMAEIPSEDPEADIVIAFTSYGTSPGSVGTTQSAAGTCVLLETARLLSGFSSDTEVRFVFLPDVSEALTPIRNYVDTLTEEERAHVIGAIQVGAQGYGNGGSLVLAMEEDIPLLAEQMNKASEELFGRTIEYAEKPSAAVNVCMRNRIPAVSLRQRKPSREYGTIFDQKELVDTKKLAENAELLGQTIYYFMDGDTPSMTAKSRYYTDIRDSVFRQKESAVLPFGRTRTELEAMTGQEGTLIEQRKDKAGHQIEVYQYPMRWFGLEQMILTDYMFRDGLLYDVMLHAAETGIDYRDMKNRMMQYWGEYTGYHSAKYGTAYDWDLELQRIGWSLVPGSDSYELSVHEYEMAPMLLSQESLAADKIRGLAQKVLPVKEEDIGIYIYTDGIGGSTGYVDRISGKVDPERSGYGIWLDQNDILTKNGAWLDEPETVRLLLKLYAERKKKEDPERYLEGCPVPEEFEQDFCWFIYKKLPEENMGGMKARLEYFYRFSDLAACREHFWKNHG